MLAIADVNVLLPVLTEGHAHYQPAARWWSRCADETVGLCLPVHMALLRLLSNARVMGSGILQPEQAWEVLDRLRADPRVVTIEQIPPLHARHWQANIRGRQPTPNLWTDAWLAALAQALDCEVVTFDRGFQAYAGLKLQLLSAG